VILDDYGYNNAFGWLLYAFHVRFLQHQVVSEIVCIKYFSHYVPQKNTTYDVKMI